MYSFCVCVGKFSEMKCDSRQEGFLGGSFEVDLNSFRRKRSGKVHCCIKTDAPSLPKEFIRFSGDDQSWAIVVRAAHLLIQIWWMCSGAWCLLLTRYRLLNLRVIENDERYLECWIGNYTQSVEKNLVQDCGLAIVSSCLPDQINDITFSQAEKNERCWLLLYGITCSKVR